ncbi:band 4A isoform X2 [Solea senegalensis]|uniref:Band 4A isoform X2 n=1 Tax=Solea senegalensis TaxID=28829 RepID=A0AAV6R0J3_SOLSE|nr:band 4A isoform X2 [Solea senegalensis]
MLDQDMNRETLNIYRSLSGFSRPQALNLFLSLCSSLQMYGVSLFNDYSVTGQSERTVLRGGSAITSGRRRQTSAQRGS